MSLLHRRHRDQNDHIIDPARPADPSTEQIGQHTSHSRFARRRSSGLKFFAPSTTPNPESSRDLHRAWEADYLKDLRVNRPARPGGSRPLPGRAATHTPEPYARAASAMSFRPSTARGHTDLNADPVRERCTSALSHRRVESAVAGGRPLVQSPGAGPALRDFSTSTAASKDLIDIQSGIYRESGMRWVEKQEARSLREALQDMDIREEAKIHAAAQDEASALVMTHKNDGNLDNNIYRPFNYKQHLEQGAYARSHSVGWNSDPSTSRADSSHLLPDGSTSTESEQDSSSNSRTTGITFQDHDITDQEAKTNNPQGHVVWDSPEKKAYMGLTSSKTPTRLKGRRRSSGPRARDVSGSLFRNPDDRIYEEPSSKQEFSAVNDAGQSRIPVPLTTRTRKNSIKNPAANPPSIKTRVASTEDKQRVYRSEIHRNPPSQSRDPFYTMTKGNMIATDQPNGQKHDPDVDRPATKDGKEIRSDDIRAATSMRMRDRSPKLPLPIVVSHRPGRPIVSFDQDWKPKDTDKYEDSSPTRPLGIPSRLRSKPPMPASTASAPLIPTINVAKPPSIQINDAQPDEPSKIPSISVTETPIPTISIDEDLPQKRAIPSPSSRPRPSPANRPLPHHSSTTPVGASNKLHWSASSRRATAQCAQCALPIEGRIVSAASQRFHPHCFTCHHCAEALECVAFYPEPDSARDARLARIEARANGTSPHEDEEKTGETALDDGDPSPRFYCHLDFHELFSPRCKSCKTPIESEVVIACGASWHAGHFFCAQCGDSFDASTPFVEREGYAWCVGCHAGRFSGKCKACRKPVVEAGVEALGGEWHVECFVCVVSCSFLRGFVG